MPISQDLHEMISGIHGLLAKLIIYAMIPLHILAALKHQFVDRDAMVARMVPGLTATTFANWRWLPHCGHRNRHHCRKYFSKARHRRPTPAPRHRPPRPRRINIDLRHASLAAGTSQPAPLRT